jgi:hypothetical protein
MKELTLQVYVSGEETAETVARELAAQHGVTLVSATPRDAREESTMVFGGDPARLKAMLAAAWS